MLNKPVNGKFFVSDDIDLNDFVVYFVFADVN